MKIHFSRHAKRRMRWRGITEDEVMEAVLHPDMTEDSTGGRKNAIRRINRKLLKVTYKNESDIIIIITALDRKRQEAS